jgi:hypothetical protein
VWATPPTRIWESGDLGFRAEFFDITTPQPSLSPWKLRLTRLRLDHHHRPHVVQFALRLNR